MRGLYQRLGWALSILENANAELLEFSHKTPNTISKFVTERRTQIDSARIILTEIIRDHKNKKEKTANESTPSNS